jgi:hypothetical protein
LATRINPSLIHAGCDYVIRTMTMPAGTSAQVSIPGFSKVWKHSGYPAIARNIPLELDYGMFAQLPQPQCAQLQAIIAGSPTAMLGEVELLPLYVWDMRREYARATAVFVLENSNIIRTFVQAAGLTPDPSHTSPSADQRAAQLYEAIQQAFGMYYLLERQHYAPFEQAVRFPAQIVHDGGGTCGDLACFYAATLWVAGCRPLICLLGEECGDRHAVVGVWNEHAPGQDVVIEARAVRRALGKSLYLIDPNGLTNCLTRPPVPYTQARHNAEEEVQERDILWGVDIDAARYSDPPILPFPGIVRPGMMDEPVLTDLPVRPADEPTTRMAEWTSQILRRYTIEVVASGPDDVGRKEPSRSSRILIGRGRTNDVVLGDQTISRAHAAILTDGTELYLQDLGSKFGTFLAGKRLRPFFPVPVERGTEFTLGPRETVRLKVVSAL